MFIAGDLTADPGAADIPCLAEGISAGWVGLLILHWRILVGLHLTLSVGSFGRVVLVRVGIFCWLSQHVGCV